MADDQEDQQPEVRLDDWKVPKLLTPIPEGFFRMQDVYLEDSYLKLLENLGIASVDESVGQEFHVCASAIRYLADVARRGDKLLYQGDEDKIPTKPIQRQILFVGSIGIYQRLDIEEQEGFNGLQLVQTGEISVAVDDLEIYRSSLHGLRRIVFGDGAMELGERVKAIIRGYHAQQEILDGAEAKRVSNLMNESRKTGEWNMRHGRSGWRF